MGKSAVIFIFYRKIYVAESALDQSITKPGAACEYRNDSLEFSQGIFDLGCSTESRCVSWIREGLSQSSV